MLCLQLFSVFLSRIHRFCSRLRRAMPAALLLRSERAQSTAEYALVLVAVTSMVAVVIAYVSGDGGGMITGLFGAAFAKMRSLIGG